MHPRKVKKKKTSPYANFMQMSAYSTAANWTAVKKNDFLRTNSIRKKNTNKKKKKKKKEKKKKRPPVNTTTSISFAYH